MVQRPLLSLPLLGLILLASAPAAATESLTLRSSWLENAGESSGEGPLRLARDDDDEDEDEEDSKKSSKRRGKSSNSGGSGVQIGTQSAAGGVSPQGKQMGVGLQLGSPTGLTGKFMLASNQGIAAGVGAGLGGLSLHVDYLWHPQVLAVADPFSLSWYLGLGGWLGFLPFPGGGPPGLYYGPGYGYGYYNGHIAVTYVPYNFLFFMPSFAVRVPLGISVALRQLPIELFGGLTPSLLVFPGIGFGLGGEIGGRIYF